MYLPLYQGRMIWHFDHRANSVRVNPESTHNPYLSEPVSEAQHADPDFLPQTQYWVPADNVNTALPESRGYTLGFRDIARPTDVRTMIAAFVPCGRVSETQVPYFSKPETGDRKDSACLAANLNAMVFDFVARKSRPKVLI